jgi:hypothetical protein
MNHAADSVDGDARREPDVIAYDITPMEDVRRKLTRALDGVQDFDNGGLSTSDLGASDNASILAFHHSVARAEYRQTMREVRTELRDFLDSFDDIKRGLDDIDAEGAARLRMLQSIALGSIEGPGAMVGRPGIPPATGPGETGVQA